MELGLLMHGMVLGFAIAAPVGPIGVLCIQKTLDQGPRYGLMAGLGAATADAMYGAVAGFGVAMISQLLVSQALGLRVVGALFLCVLGLRTWRTPPGARAAQATATGAWGVYLTTLGLTLTNPMTILSFTAIFAGVGVGSGGQAPLGAMLLVMGVFLGSAGWWLLLCGGVGMLRQKVRPQHLLWVNRGAGLVMLVFGLALLVGR